MLKFGRRGLLLGAAALAAGCNGGSGGGSGAESPDDMALGAEGAPATLIEYASSTCPHCAEFHEAVWEQLKTTYIDTGKLRFIFREFPTAPAPVAVAGFQIARCGGADAETYFTRLGVLFEQQQTIMASGTMDGVREALITIGAASNLSREQVTACISDEAGAERIRRIVESGVNEYEITGTPTLILNGRKLEDPNALTWEGLSRAIDAAIAGT